MESRDNASAARTCLVVLGIFAIVILLVLAVFVVRVTADDNGSRSTPQDQTGGTKPLVFTVMDVGQGLSVVVITPDGRSLVADGGRSPAIMEQRIIPYLRTRGVSKVDYVVCTNPDQDHLGGLERLLQDMPVGTWVDPVVPNTNQAYARELELVRAKGITPLKARRGGRLDLGPDVAVDILWPTEPLLKDGADVSNNDNSVVLRLAYGATSYIISGDIQQPAEQRIVDLAQGSELRADALVVAHHGSKTSSSDVWLDAVQPRLALIGVGLNNQYGHPHDAVLRRLRARNVAVYRTDLDGTIELTSDGQRIVATRFGPMATP